MFFISRNKLVLLESFFYLPKLIGVFLNRQQSNARAGQKKHMFYRTKKQTHQMGKICLLKINIKLNDYK